MFRFIIGIAAIGFVGRASDPQPFSFFVCGPVHAIEQQHQLERILLIERALGSIFRFVFRIEPSVVGHVMPVG